MPDLNIRNVGLSLIRAINVAAAKADLTQRHWVIETLTKATGGVVEERGGEKPRPGNSGRHISTHSGAGKPVLDAPAGVQTSPVILGAKCEICAAPVRLLERYNAPAKWRCTGPRQHSMTPRKLKTENEEVQF